MTEDRLPKSPPKAEPVRQFRIPKVVEVRNELCELGQRDLVALSLLLPGTRKQSRPRAS